MISHSLANLTPTVDTMFFDEGCNCMIFLHMTKGTSVVQAFRLSLIYLILQLLYNIFGFDFPLILIKPQFH